MWSVSAQIRPYLAEFQSISATIGRFRPMFRLYRSDLAEIGQRWLKLIRTWSTSAQTWPTFVQFWWKSALVWLISPRVSWKSVQMSRTQANLDHCAFGGMISQHGIGSGRRLHAAACAEIGKKQQINRSQEVETQGPETVAGPTRGPRHWPRDSVDCKPFLGSSATSPPTRPKVLQRWQCCPGSGIPLRGRQRLAGSPSDRQCTHYKRSPAAPFN